MSISLINQPNVVPVIEVPSAADFYRLYVKPGKLVVISGLANGWKAKTLWERSYLNVKYADCTVSAIKVLNNATITDPSIGYKLESLSLHHCLTSQENNHIGEVWSVATALDDLPGIANDIITPDHLFAGHFLRKRLFIAPDRYITTLHQDLMENLYVCVSGIKHITLFAPTDKVYRYPFHSSLPNAARVDPDNPDYEKFPLFIHAKPYTVILHPGDALFIPSLWWHHLRSIGQTTNVSFWWSQGWKLPLVWSASVYKKVLGI
jgi:lysine-specific demethylase 8